MSMGSLGDVVEKPLEIYFQFCINKMPFVWMWWCTSVYVLVQVLVLRKKMMKSLYLHEIRFRREILLLLLLSYIFVIHALILGVFVSSAREVLLFRENINTRRVVSTFTVFVIHFSFFFIVYGYKIFLKHKQCTRTYTQNTGLFTYRKKHIH